MNKDNPTESTLSLSFDNYQRYRMLADAISAARGGKLSLNLLDVGTSQDKLSRFLEKDRVLCTDVGATEGTPPKNFLYSSGTDLPFKDGVFDLTISSDVLEHVPPAGREAFLSELLRVSSMGALIAAPFHSPEVRKAEEDANLFYQKAFGHDHIWLAEHLRSPLPSLEDTLSFLKGEGYSTAVLANGFLPHWLMMIKLTLFMEIEYRPALDSLNWLYNSTQYLKDNQEPSYRHLIVAFSPEFSGLGKRIEAALRPQDETDANESPVTTFAKFSMELLEKIVEQNQSCAQNQAETKPFAEALERIAGLFKRNA